MEKSYIQEEALVEREMSYREYVNRMGAAGQHGNAVNGLWKDLAEYFVFFGGIPKKAESSLPECTMPVNGILELPPHQFRDFPGIGPARAKVYSALYRSLHANPRPVGQQDPSHDLTLEGFQAYASSKYSKGTITNIWNKLHRNEGIAPGRLSFAQLEAFCAKLQSKNPPSGFKESGALLLGWYEHLKGAR